MEKEKEYETIIVGAGLAGLIAGRYLKNSLILDKKKSIGKPVQCGEVISKNGLKLQRIRTSPNWICSRIHQIQRIMPNGKIIGDWHNKPIGYTIDREKFEKALAKKVKGKIKLNSPVVDLQFRNNTWFVTTQNGKVFKSFYLIGADGVNSIVRKKVFPENQKDTHFIPAIEYLVKTAKEFDTKSVRIFLDHEKYPQGYAWVFPKSKNTANVGVGGIGNLRQRFDYFLKKVIEKNFGKVKLLQNKSGVVSLRNKNAKFLKNNAMLVGDAAGFADPMFKGGMSQAMLSGKIAAQCILKEEVAEYEKKIEKMPFASNSLIKTGNILYSFNNKTLNNLGEVFENGESSHPRLRTLSNFTKAITKPELIKNFPKLFMFSFIWERKEDYLW